MQIPGAKCRICNRSVIVAPDGTWCDKCASVFHTACLVDQDETCPTCNAKYTPPEEMALRDAQGMSHRVENFRRPARLGPMLEIITGGLLLASPAVFILAGIGLALTGDSSSDALGVLPFMIIFMILGVVLLVDGERNFRGGRQQQN